MPGGGHVLHNLCVLDGVERVPVGNPVCCPEEECSVCHGHDLVIIDVAGIDTDVRDIIGGLAGEAS